MNVIFHFFILFAGLNIFYNNSKFKTFIIYYNSSFDT